MERDTAPEPDKHYGGMLDHDYSDQLGYLQFSLDDYFEKCNDEDTTDEDRAVYMGLIDMTQAIVQSIMKARRMDYLRYHSDEGFLKGMLVSDNQATLEVVRAEGGSLELPSDADIDNHLREIEASNGKH